MSGKDSCVSSDPALTKSGIVQDFCYYANAIFVFLLLVQPDNEKLFMICFAFSEVRHRALISQFDNAFVLS